MKTTLRSILALRPCLLAGAAALLLAAFPTRARAVYTLTLQQVGNDVVLTGSGTLNTAGLISSQPDNYDTGVAPKFAYALVGPSILNAITYYPGLSGPTNFGIGGGGNAPAGTGSVTGIYGAAEDLIVPRGYVSNSPLSGTLTLRNETFASIGFTPGIYTWTWGHNSTSDSFVVTGGVPEPATWAGGALLLGATVLTLRRRFAAAPRA